MVKSKIDNGYYTQLQKMHYFVFTAFYFLINKQFSSTDSGFTDWKKCLEKVEQHEKNLMHNESIRIWFSRRKITTGIDVELKIELEKRELYWRSIIHRLIETVIFLSGRGLAFRGDNEG